MKYLEKFKLGKKTAFILGGSGLIGREIVRATHEAGAKVVVLEKNFNKKINFQGKNIKYEKFDVSSPNKIEEKYKKLQQKYGTPDIFINSSYPKTNDWKLNSFEKIKYKSFAQNLELHLNSFSWFAKIVADSMVKSKKKGTIIQLSSIYGIVGQDLSIYQGTDMKESMSYSIIKGGINNLTRQMSSFYGKFNIRINSLCAGGVRDISQNKLFLKNYNKKVPLKRLAEPSEIAAAVLFLSSDASSYITGTMFVVDGGWTSI